VESLFQIEKDSGWLREPLEKFQNKLPASLKQLAKGSITVAIPPTLTFTIQLNNVEVNTKSLTLCVQSSASLKFLDTTVNASLKLVVNKDAAQLEMEFDSPNARFELYQFISSHDIDVGRVDL
jgi:hypothetical protein